MNLRQKIIEILQEVQTMKINHYPLTIIIILAFFLSGCSSDSTSAKDHLTQVYCLALDSFMTLDKGLNCNMKYIAIDTETLKDLDASNKEAIIEYLGKYNVDVIAASLDDLKTMGMFNDKNLSIEGVLLKFENITINESSVILNGSKFRSGKGAIGVKCEITIKNNEVKVKSSKITWIS